ncbi:MAG: fibronectin type III domain-containing protein [Verrucomicrobia bacterium]|nr:fibronectin type III domain-containing protein [Verrucomicrobiota bacterium]
MKQTIDKNEANLLASGTAVANGVDKLGAALDLDPNTANAIRTAGAEFSDARMALQHSRAAVRARKRAVRSSVTTGKQLATLAREILKPHLGSRYSQWWDIAGFVGALAIPRKMSNLSLLLKSLATYLTDHPEREVAALNVTAAQAELVAGELQAAIGALNLAKTELETRRKARKTSRKKLRLRLRLFIADLNTRIDPLDNRWLSFGLNRPGAKDKPEAPEKVEVVMIAENTLAVKWEDAPRAESYRVRQRIVGVDEEFVLIGSPVDPNFTIEQAPRNATLELAISAVNSGGESAWSEVVMVRTGGLE